MGALSAMPVSRTFIPYEVWEGSEQERDVMKLPFGETGLVAKSRRDRRRETQGLAGRLTEHSGICSNSDFSSGAGEKGEDWRATEEVETELGNEWLLVQRERVEIYERHPFLRNKELARIA